jgi:hypothetical protein
MKISVDGKELFTLTETQKNVMRNNIMGDIFEDDLKRRLHWVLTHKYEQCFKELKEEWDPKLKANGVTMVPTDEELYAQLVFSQPNYKDRSAREASK